MSHKFTLPELPASMNALYQIIYSQKRVEMKPEVRLWRNRMKDYIPPWTIGEDVLLWIGLEFWGNWYTKKGEVRKVDLSNMVKVTQDVIAEKLKFDDSRIFEQRWLRKIQSDEQRVEVELGVMLEISRQKTAL